MVQALEAELRGLGKDVELHRPPGADHAFFNDTRPEVYDADASRRSRGLGPWSCSAPPSDPR